MLLELGHCPAKCCPNRPNLADGRFRGIFGRRPARVKRNSDHHWLMPGRSDMSDARTQGEPSVLGQDAGEGKRQRLVEIPRLRCRTWSSQAPRPPPTIVASCLRLALRLRHMPLPPSFQRAIAARYAALLNSQSKIRIYRPQAAQASPESGRSWPRSYAPSVLGGVLPKLADVGQPRSGQI